MNRITPTLLGALAIASFATAQSTSADGEKPSYTFREALLNGRGVQSLEDLAGRPVLVEFWGTR